MVRSIWRLLRAQHGATAIEYGLLVGLIALVTLVSVTTIGTALNAQFNTLGTKVSSAG